MYAAAIAASELVFYLVVKEQTPTEPSCRVVLPLRLPGKLANVVLRRDPRRTYSLHSSLGLLNCTSYPGFARSAAGSASR